jgi:hypothetical protein
MSEIISEIRKCRCNICQDGSILGIFNYHNQVNLLLSRLNEPQRRWFVGTLSQQPNSPTDEQLSLITGLDEKTIRRGRCELQEQLNTVPKNRLRKEGGGQPSKEKKARLLNQI